ncbi:Phosphoglycolate phosphatase [Pseudoruegeria aquimaris]|uniref:phosphoglycolate phosphatase n=1 Tax=Pseudoruegeria aquimaris TaxID=393663 RepID=A0A1Y5T9E7_9RHOB|nr:HAD family hydrolase [Pseudoruegeria aquimaris]SLN56971.1 Phosphoglycolate phosphatase [Pseudoruegeria aquimaris]
MTDIRAVLFDKDGTLFDFNATWSAWAHGFLGELSGGDPALAGRLGRAIGYDMELKIFEAGSPVIAGTPGEIAEAMLPLLPGQGAAALIEQMNRAAAQAPMVEAAPLVDLLGRLKAVGLRLGVATNDAEAPARAHLAATGVLGHFDFVAGFDSGHGAKPDPGMLLAFAEAVGVPPAQVLMVGDSRHDLLAGRAAGMPTLGVLTGLAQEEELAPLALAVLPHIGHLPDWLGGRASERALENAAG